MVSFGRFLRLVRGAGVVSGEYRIGVGILDGSKDLFVCAEVDAEKADTCGYGICCGITSCGRVGNISIGGVGGASMGVAVAYG
jgi:hypothetical protein